jgi:hypothetical protein
LRRPQAPAPVAFDADAPLFAAAGPALAGLGLAKLLAVARFLALRRRA